MDWYITCTDSLNNIGFSDNRTLDTQIGGGSNDGGGGSGGDDAIVISNVSKKACEYTYEIANNEPIEYFKINDVIEILKIEENKDYSYTDLKIYIDNWQSLCSDKINRTLKEDTVCEEIYYFILGNNHNFTYIEFSNLRNNIESENDLDISLDVLNNYYINYNELCYLEGYSDKLPNKPISAINFSKIFDMKNCTPDLGIDLLDEYIPLGEWDFGGIGCFGVNFWKIFLKLEKRESYIVLGIKPYWIIGLVIIYAIIILLRRRARKKIKSSSG